MSMPEGPQQPTKKALLIVIDGWGISEDDFGNAIKNAKTPRMDWFRDNAAWTTLDASGNAVGLPAGVMGNSEVGHLTCGAGQCEYQDLVRIDLSITKDTLKTNPTLVSALEQAKAKSGRIHFLGLLSDAGVHSHINHLFYMLNVAKEHQVPHSFVHAFSDGRDTAPDSGVTYIKQVLDHCSKTQYGSLATVMGRFYAMDRDKRWERVDQAVQGLIQGKGEACPADNLIALMTKRYSENMTDEFMTPIIVNEDGLIKEGDTMIFFDFRADRMREIVQYFGQEYYDAPPHTFGVLPPKGLALVQLTQYKAEFPFPVVFPQQKLQNVLSEWLSKLGLKQFHCAETEKYAHVTFFFNGGREEAFHNEDRKMVSSPKVATYDLKPEMSMHEVATEVVAAVSTEEYPFVLCNFAGPDMVGHTGFYEKALIAVETCDAAIGMIYDACVKHGYTLFVTADHGNAEVMKNPDGTPVTSHTTNPVPFVIADGKTKHKFVSEKGTLADVAPTLLKVIGLPVPKEMTGSIIAE
eukprot:TRINITY_DN7678_c0_g1::TRINITY_DN7678_c0_g1_i1::g.18559::m.18559 TRINITY_DN7678_c0_g1::TRINITY_DN7678_c0_g1_i1::g.18559  ORF type:complete len:540 (-),score=197.05,sp/I6LDA6/GPMI_ONCVO/54.04/0.0,Metalloenzyme/PF01676.13/7e-83,iPGM_N/PF06415.8/1.5e-67,Phosphodiest/PF01663.17/2.2e+03,Phosphodiest/PF01663.17/7.6e-08,Sulfatase/PF00884.18/0.0064,PglZ/PF08665.7/1.6e+03,PglZ/PF08665.7/2.4e+03,PglZ/PF08665.7/0.43 TRINITY_DN7678_c0_g1_i1:161-1723(-)